MLRCSCTFESGVQYLSERETESAFVAKSASEKRWRSSPLQHTDTADRPGLGPNNKSFSLSVFHTVRLSLCRLSLLLSLTCFALPSSCHSPSLCSSGPLPLTLSPTLSPSALSDIRGQSRACWAFYYSHSPSSNTPANTLSTFLFPYTTYAFVH